MQIIPSIYSSVSRYWHTETGMKLKDKLRPAKHFLVGKNSIYKAIEEVQEREASLGRSVNIVFDIGAAIGETVCR